MRTVAYIRVSTDRQAEEGLGLDVQEAAVRRWADDHGHQVVAMCRDEGVSGTNGVDARVGLPDALAMLEAGEAEALVVHRLDRLARALHVQEAVLGRAWAAGARVYAVADGGEVHADDPDDPMRTFVRQVMGAAAQLDRSLLTKRMRDGKRLKAARGGYTGGPRMRAPYGYELEAGEYVPVASEQRTVSRIMSLRDQGASLRAICAELESAGTPPPSGARWHPQTVAKIVARSSDYKLSL